VRNKLVIILLTASCAAAAQEADTLAPASVYSVKTLPVVKASEQVFLPSLTAPPTQIADILRNFTGVQVKDYGGVGGLKTVNVRSLGSEHVGVFIDGIQVDNAQNMQVDLGRFSANEIGMVSLYSGQKSARLQTASEYICGAAVHLESASPRSGLRARIRGGSFGTINPSLSWVKDLGHMTLSISGEYLGSNGRYKYQCFDTTLVRENGDIKSLRLETKLSGKLTGGQWNLHLYSYGSERGFPGPVIRRAAGFPFSAERQADQDLFVQGGWVQEWTSRYSTALRLKYSNSYTHYNTHPEKNPMALPYNLHYRQQSGYLSLAQSLILADPWSVDFSADIRHSALDSDAGQSVTPRRTEISGALATRLAWEKFRASAHIAYLGAWDRFDTPSAGGWSRENAFREAWMPSLNLFYSPFKWLELSAFARRSYRLPSFNDLYYSLMGNSALSPESALQIGADIRARASFGRWSMAFRLSPYYNLVTDKIVAIPTSSQFRWTMLNIGKVDVTGLDAKAEAGYSHGKFNIGMVLRYTFQSALDHSTPGSQTWGNQIPYIPRHSGSVSLSAFWRNWNAAWDTVVTGERWSRSANTSDYYIRPWTVSDASVGRKFDLPVPKGRVLEITAGLACRNIFNHQYQIVQGYPMPGTSVMINLSVCY